jgi:hypothetical protein
MNRTDHGNRDDQRSRGHEGDYYSCTRGRSTQPERFVVGVRQGLRGNLLKRAPARYLGWKEDLHRVRRQRRSGRRGFGGRHRIANRRARDVICVEWSGRLDASCTIMKTKVVESGGRGTRPWLLRLLGASIEDD